MIKKRKVRPPYNGIMQRVFAYQNEGGALIGSGWLIHRDDGQTLAPDLYDLKGDNLSQGWYTLQTTNETKLVVIPRLIQ